MKNKVWRIAEKYYQGGDNIICRVFDMSAAAVLS